MSLCYLIDGYNVIETHREYFPGNARNARDKLISLIHSKRPEGSSKNKIIIFFDGQPGVTSPKTKWVDVRFTSGKEADWYIKKYVEENQNPRQLIVVTDDRAIQRHVVSFGAAKMSTDEFMRKLYGKPASSEDSYSDIDDKQLSPEEIQKINEEFMRKKGLD